MVRNRREKCRWRIAVALLGLPALAACGGWAADRPLTLAVVLAVNEAQGWSIEQGVAVGMEEVASVFGWPAGFKVWRSPKSPERMTGVQLTVSDSMGGEGCVSDFKWVSY